MGQLTELHLAESHFQGYMPTTLSLLAKLMSINVEGNLFDFQSVPSWISNLTLTSFTGGQSFTGTTPPTLGHLKLLISLDLSSSELTGVLPSLPFSQYTRCNLQDPSATSRAAAERLGRMRGVTECTPPPPHHQRP